MKKRVFGLLLIICILLSLPFGALAADQPKDKSLPLTNEASYIYNCNLQNYRNLQTIYDSIGSSEFYRYTSNVVFSYLVNNGDGSVTVVELNPQERVVVLEQYNADFQMIWKQKLPYEMGGCAGFYAGKDYNFFVYGQNNPDEDDTKEVFRVVRYTKNWHRVDAASICGANTTEPIPEGTLRMAQVGDLLYINTCHEVYAANAGAFRQQSMVIVIRISDMEPTSILCKFTGPIVMRSLNAFVIEDEGNPVFLGQADTFPQGYMLSVGRKEYTPPYFSYTNKILGNEYSGTSVGGFEASTTHYLFAGTAIDPEAEFTRTLPGNVVIYSVDKKDFSPFAKGFSIHQLSREYDGVKYNENYLTDYREGDGVQLTTPQFTKVGSDHFLVLWSEARGRESKLHYVFVDGTGTPVSKPVECDGALSDCQPILVGDRVIWYVCENTPPHFYSVEVPAEYRKVVPPKTVPELGPNPFKDVKEGQYFYAPVNWAVNHDPQITSGTSKDKFSPDIACTRAQMVTFLWRAMGQPEPTIQKNPFTDVKPSDYYYKAVLWAVENKITAGMSATSFKPNATVTRAQTVTFLWRMEGKPEASNMDNPFIDVAAGQYFTDAVLWAVENEITSGTSVTTFDPLKSCTRAQIVTFLYRDLAIK